MARLDKVNDGILLTCDDVIEDSNHFDEMIKAMIKRYDDFLYECFEKYGFTKDWLLNPDHRRHIKIDRYTLPGSANHIDSVYIHSIHLFTVAMIGDYACIGYKMIAAANPIEIKKLFGFPVEEVSNEPN